MHVSMTKRSQNRDVLGGYLEGRRWTGRSALGCYHQLASFDRFVSWRAPRIALSPHCVIHPGARLLASVRIAPLTPGATRSSPRPRDVVVLAEIGGWRGFATTEVTPLRCGSFGNLAPKSVRPLVPSGALQTSLEEPGGGTLLFTQGST